MSGKKSCEGKVALLLAAYLCPFLTLLSLCISFWFQIMHCCIPSHTSDNNTSNGMIWVTLNMGRSAGSRQGNVMELSGNFTLSREWSPWYQNRSASRHQLLVPRYRLSSLARRSFAVAGPMTLNSLSADLCDPTCSDESFRRTSKTFLFAKY